MQWIKLTDRMPNPDEHDRVLFTPKAVMAIGFCPRCEWRPCECEGQYDD